MPLDHITCKDPKIMQSMENRLQQVEDSADVSNFVRQGSLRKVIPGDHNNENLFLKREGELNKLYKAIHLEYIILAEYKIVISEDISGIYVIPSRDNCLTWFGVIFVKSGPYEDGIFRFDLMIDSEFPNTTKPPVVQFQSNIFHPAINIETSELHLSKAFPKWDKRDNHIWQVLKFILWIFNNVEGSIAHAINEEAVMLYKNNHEEFTSRAKKVVEESLEHLYDEPSTDDKHYMRFEPYNPNLHESARAQLLTQRHDDFFKLNNSWVLPGSMVPLGRPPTPDSEQES